MDVAKIIEEIDNIIYTVSLVKDEPNPDWLNQHDYASGYFIGRKNASSVAATNLLTIRTLLERINGKVPS